MSNQQGWVCPKCGNVYAPWVKECCNCNGGGDGGRVASPVTPKWPQPSPSWPAVPWEPPYPQPVIITTTWTGAKP